MKPCTKRRLQSLPVLLAALLYLNCTTLAAAPAPWYWWRSKATGHRVCAQTSPGNGWERLRGAYRDALCRHRSKPGRYGSASNLRR